MIDPQPDPRPPTSDPDHDDPDHERAGGGDDHPMEHADAANGEPDATGDRSTE